MSTGPISAPSRTSAPQPARAPAHAPSHDAKALADEFSAAARRGQLPLTGRGGAGEKDAKGPRQLVRIGPDGKAPPAQAVAALKALGDGRKRDGLGETRRDDSATAMQLLGPQNSPVLAAPVQAPQGNAHVDPSAFAELLTQIWTREQGKTAREVRVSFGDGAWPATGATLLRLEDGSLRVTVSVGRHGGGGDLDALRERLNARGLNVADVAVEDELG